MKNKEIAALLDEYALLLELHGENSFKISAYKKAARALKNLELEIVDFLKDGKKLTEIKGIGKSISENILKILQSGSFKSLEELKEKTPEFLYEMTNISGIGPKKAYQLFYDLGINSLGELEYACYENRLKLLKGFGEKSQKKILKGIKFYKKHKNKLLYPEALQIVNNVFDVLKQLISKDKIVIVGEIRRKCEIIDKIDILVVIDNININDFINKFNGKLVNENCLKFDFLDNEIFLHFADNDELVVKLFELTGSEIHINKIRKIYDEKGIKYGLFLNENELYEKIGLPFIPPELREGVYEFDLFKNEDELININDIRGILHIHTVYSDGSMSIKDVVDEALKRGVEYVGISDHSKSSYIANGLNEERVLEQFKEIEHLQQNVSNIKILKGIECDILQDGSLDFSNDFLKRFDFVIASVHSYFNLSKEDMTKRLIRAVENPYVNILAHPTGRLLLSREGYKFNEDEVYKACAENRVAVELNANPHRLDIDWRKMEYVHKFNLMVSINPDAHHLDGFDDLKYGINIARKGCLKKDQVLNSLPVELLFKK